MISKFIMAACMLCTVAGVSYAQTYSAPASAGTGNVNNVFLGTSAGAATTNGGNVFTGFEAGKFNIGGAHNVFSGYRAGIDNTEGSYNIFIGSQTGSSIGSWNIYIGASSGKNQKNSWNTVVGVLAGEGNASATTYGHHNSYFGYKAGQLVSSDNSSNNVMVGAFSGLNGNEIDHSTYIGYNSGAFLKKGDYNVYLGANAGIGNVGSADFEAKGNTYIGSHSGQNNTTGSYNVFLGRSAGLANGAGNNNVYLGYLAGSASTGSNNVFIGNNAGQNEINSNRLYIANSNSVNPLIYGEFRSGSGSSLAHGALKFNAQKVGVGYDSTGSFGAFPLMSTITNASDYRFFVKGGILAEEVRVRLQSGWADYVFANDYKLLSLKDTEKYITANGHLPNMPSAKEVEEQGIEMGNIVKLQQEKIEELTLHLIEQDKQIEVLKAQAAEIDTLKAQMQLLLKKQ